MKNKLGIRENDMVDVNQRTVLMCGSALSNGGGVVTVTKNLLDYPDWNNYRIIYVPTHINGSAIKKLLCFVKGYFTICRLISHERIDIAHLHTCDGGPFYRKGILLRLIKRRGIKVVLHHHTDYTEFFSSINGIKRKFVIKTLNKSDCNIVLGKNLIKPITDLTSNAAICVVHNGINPRKARTYNSDGKNILYMGWLLERKGVFDLINAIKSIDDKLEQKYKLALCGSGNDEIIRKIEECGIQHRIGFLGWVEGKEKDDILNNSVINVLPSYREGAPMTILEAMSYGIPCVASNISTIPEIVQDNVSGILVNPHNPKELGEAMLRLINDKNKRDEMSKHAFSGVSEKFSVKHQVAELSNLYNKLLE